MTVAGEPVAIAGGEREDLLPGGVRSELASKIGVYRAVAGQVARRIVETQQGRRVDSHEHLHLDAGAMLGGGVGADGAVRTTTTTFEVDVTGGECDERICTALRMGPRVESADVEGHCPEPGCDDSTTLGGQQPVEARHRVVAGDHAHVAVLGSASTPLTCTVGVKSRNQTSGAFLESRSARVGRTVEQTALDLLQFVVGDVRQRLRQGVRFREVDPAGLELGTNLMQAPSQIAAEPDHSACGRLGEPEDAGHLDVRELAMVRLVSAETCIFFAAGDEQRCERIDLTKLLTRNANVPLDEHGGDIRVRLTQHPHFEHKFDNSRPPRQPQVFAEISPGCPCSRCRAATTLGGTQERRRIELTFRPDEEGSRHPDHHEYHCRNHRPLADEDGAEQYGADGSHSADREQKHTDHGYELRSSVDDCSTDVANCRRGQLRRKPT